MRKCSIAKACSVFALVFVSQLAAQRPPSVRQIGKLERASTDSLASVATALPMPGGNVLVNDVVGRRVLLFDSALSHPTVVADTTSVTAAAYGQGGATLIRYRADTAILISPSTLSMLVIAPSGTIARVMAIPRPDDAPSGGSLGVPGFDVRGRLLYFSGVQPGIMMLGRGEPIPDVPRLRASIAASRRTDSGAVVRIDLTTRVLDTAAMIRIPKSRRELKVDAQGLLQSIETTPDPLPLIDAWTVLPDGTIAVLRSRDYHVDWLGPSGSWSSTPKMPFDWARLTDDRKRELIDSTVKVWQAQYDRAAARRRNPVGSGTRGGATGGRGGGGSGAGGGPAAELAPNIAVPAALGELPDYMPPLSPGREHPLSVDADGHLWIRTTTLVQGRPVYDIVNRRGELFDRVQLPPFRTIAGFGPGVIYMAVKDSTGAVRLERARIK